MNEKVKIAIVGSKEFTDYQTIEEFVFSKISLGQIACVVSGAAQGVDTLAREFAQKHNLEMVEFPPNWKLHGKQAGFLRNTSIIENADIVFAFPMGKSKGTRDSMEKALKMSKALYTHECTIPIFKLTLISICGDKAAYPEFDVSQQTIGFFSTLKNAEQNMEHFIKEQKENNIYAFLIQEYATDRCCCGNAQSKRSYLPNGKLMDENLLPEDCSLKFPGRSADKIRFQRGDIVEVLHLHTNKVSLEVVSCLPFQIEEVQQRQQDFLKENGILIHLDYGDDCYRTLTHDDGHSYPQSLFVFPPRFLINDELKKALLR